MKPVIIGTAGHIDHGKSALVKALTGTDPDRFEEEKRRGMTIDIGFAFLSDDVAIIDVPGHERFIKNMVTGVSSIDYALLVVAADDGIMPQTREHLNVLKLLGVSTGAIIISKTDLVDSEWLSLVKEDISRLVRGTFLVDAPVFEVSTVTGENLEKLKKHLLDLPRHFQQTNEENYFRLPIDRVFTLKGFGTIVTGTIISGEIVQGAEIEILPLAQKVKIRGIQSHGRPVIKIGTGHRASLNLQGVSPESIDRGCFLATPGLFQATRLLTCQLHLLPRSRALPYNARCRLHIGTGEYIVRMRWVGSSDLQPGESGIVQFHFEESVTASFKETFVLRSYSPAETIGGGLVLDNRPSLLRKKDQVAAAAIWQLAAMQLKEALIWFIEYTPPFFFSIPELVFRFTELPEKLQNVFNSLLTTQQVIRIAKFYLAAKRYQIWQSALLSVLKNHHSQNPVSPGLDKMALMRFIQLPLEIIDHLVADLSINGNLQKTDDLISLKGFSPRLSPEQERLKQKIEQQVLSAGFNPPDSKQLMQQFRADPQTILVLVKLLIHEGKLEMIEGQLLYHQDILVEGRRRLQEHLRKVGKASVSELKELLETSRKWALPLLNYYDQKGVTFRDGVYRKLVE